MNYENIFKTYPTYNRFFEKTYNFIRIWLLKNHYQGVIIDIGCGRGNYLKKLVIEEKYNVIGLEPSVLSEHESMFIAHSTIKNYDYPVIFPTGYCVDVLEHINANEINENLLCLKNMAKKILIGIANHSDVWEGEELHLIQKDANWWKVELKKVFSSVNLLFEEKTYCLFEVS